MAINTEIVDGLFDTILLMAVSIVGLLRAGTIRARGPAALGRGCRRPAEVE